ncbi:MAG TPA: hypothetical protein VFA96_08600 [Nocardioides sp.]|nr:hypothetical protein [Nocardioides sp.]
MSVAVTGYDQVAFRMGVFWRPVTTTAGAFAWPRARFSFGAVGCSVSAPGHAKRIFAWTDVETAERTRHGVRFQFHDGVESITIGSFNTGERMVLVDVVRTYCPAGAFDDTEPERRWRRLSAAPA